MLMEVAGRIFSSFHGLLWIDVQLHRAENFQVEVQSHILSLGFDFHSQALPTDVIKAVDNAGSIHSFLDTFIVHFAINLVTALMAIVQLFHRFGPYMVLVCTNAAVYYFILERRYLAVATAQYEKSNTLRDEKER
ncbi:hypothetical protein B0H63DRAFT_218380 [Podospora didyma]|uniref:Uncharacterized protein n=1 Tax=Podospora didyma TaxID=330526 RepID=A0AAE0NIE3_9PEZI|nr:hypothetical protein B0H63DRAFT_218380 [Podospora didyma]